MQRTKNSFEHSCKEIIDGYHHTIIEQFTVLKQQVEGAELKYKVLDDSIATITEKLEEITHGKVRSQSFTYNIRNTKNILKDKETQVIEKQWMDKIKTICERIDTFMLEKSMELQIKQELLEKKELELSRKDVERKEEIEQLRNKIHDLETKLQTKVKKCIYL